MKFFLKILLSFLFIPIFLIFLILTSLKFQILNYEYLVSSFERNNIYKSVESFQQSVVLEQEKKAMSAGRQGLKGELDIKITPEIAKEFLEKNLKSILGFLNGDSGEIKIFIPEQGEIELTKLAPNFPKETLEKAKNIGNYALLGWVITTLLIIGVIFLHFQLGWKKDKLSEIYFLVIGIILIILGFLLRFFLMHMARDLVAPGNSEPSQVLIGMMAGSILPEIVNVWIFIAASLVLFSSGVLIFKKIKS